MEPLCVILGIIIAVVVVAFVGHAIWLAFAVIGKALLGESDPAPDATTSKQSEKPLTPTQQMHQDLNAAIRLLGYGKYRGWLTDEQVNQVKTLIQGFAARARADELAAANHIQPTGASTETPLAIQSMQAVSVEPIAIENATDDTAANRLNEASIASEFTRPPVTSQPISSVAQATPAHTQPQRQQVGQPVHPLDQPEPVVVEAKALPPAKPRKQLTADLLQTFMEQSNIRWIEIISATLIVVCSVGLVISLWNTLSATSRYFPSLVFLLATVAVHGAGQYTLRKWKLRTTSRGILQIGLMLIPLAVLVGILLSRRPDQLPSLDPMTVAVLGVGTLVYGGLAVTACQALFSTRWLGLAIATIVGSLTLVPIHYLAAHEKIQLKPSAAVLIPLVLVSLWNVLQLSSTACLPISSAGRTRRIAGQVLQVIFAALVPCVFWVMQSRNLGVSHTATACGGLLLAGWSSWGWTASLKRLTNRFNRTCSTKQHGASVSWYILVAWLLAGVCTLALAALVWQAADNRKLLELSLLAIGVWWTIHGLRIGLMTSLIAATIALGVSATLYCEGLLPEAERIIQARDWLTLPRVGLLTVFSLVFAGLSAGFSSFGLPPGRHFSLSAALDNSAGWQASLAKLPFALFAGATIFLVASASLTVVACLTPVSTPEFGGNWAPLMLLVYGMILIGVSTFRPNFLEQEPRLNRLVDALLILGQGVLLLAFVRLCHSAPRLPAWIVELRPRYAWAVGVGSVSVIWAGFAAASRMMVAARAGSTSENTRQSFSFRVEALSYAAIAGAIVAAVEFWIRNDHLFLLSVMGWVLPLVLGLACFALRNAALRELTLLATSAWILGSITSLGLHRDWWSQAGITATTSVLVIAVILILAIHSWLFERKPAAEATAWYLAGGRWASDLLLNVAWISLMVTVLVVGLLQLYLNLHLRELPEKFFVSAPLTLNRILATYPAIAALVAFTLASTSVNRNAVRLWLCAVPLLFAVTLGCLVNAPYGVPAALAIIGLVAIACQILPFTRLSWGQQLAQSKSIDFDNFFRSLTPHSWLKAVESVAFGAVGITTLLVFLEQIRVGLPEPLCPLAIQANTYAGWLNNILRLSIWASPLVVVLGMNCLKANLLGESSKSLQLIGTAFGLSIIAMTTLAGAFEPKQIVVLALKSFTLTMFVVAGLTLSITTGRNWIGLRELDRQSSAIGLLGKARKGARYREAEKATWNIWLASIVPAIAICIMAAIVVSVYPHRQFALINQVGSVTSIVVVALALSMWWLLGTNRGMSKFGLLAITLGLLSPVISACYAAWLVDHPASRSQFANNFEPVRLQICLWLTSLVVALAIRIHCAIHARKMSWAGEIAWVSLAALVGVLSLVGYSDSYWATGQLASLALIVIISSETSGQTWRGFIAALLGMLAWSPWYSSGLASHGGFFAWQSLVSVAIVGLMAVAVRATYRAYRIEIVPQFNFSVDRLAVLLLPFISVAASGLWAMLGPVRGPSDWVLWVILATSFATALLAVARLWESLPSGRGLGVYCSVLSLVLVAIQFTMWRAEAITIYRSLGWWVGVLGTMTIMATLLRQLTLQPESWYSMLNLRNLASPARLSHACSRMSLWHTVVSLFCLVPAIWMVLTMEREGLRLAAIALPLLGASSILPLSFARNFALQRGTVLMLVSATLILAWWADLPSAWAMRSPGESWLFVQRAFLALTLLSIVYPVVEFIRNKQDEWAGSLSRAGWVCSGLSLLVGTGLMLGMLSGHWDRNVEVASVVAKVMTLVGWVAVFARLIQFAAWPKGADRACSIQVRTGAVYVAELAIGIACGTAYFMFPELFKGRLANWWPVIMFAIAFASTGLGQLFRRVNLPILADPISRSSLLLPLIPLAGVWAFQPPRVTVLWNQFDNFALLLVLGSSLYALHGWIRGSVRLRAVSGLLALLGFWSFLQHHPNLHFFEHPQFWLLPPAISSLLFVEWNKNKLAASVVTSVRYLAILVAYMSSTAEMFFKAFEGQLWPPIVLLFLALCGAVAGIVMKIKPFLFCSLVFIVVALIGMVLHATQAIDQNWPWWAFGISVGVCLIVALGYFEKNRPKILAYLEELKKWN